MKNILIIILIAMFSSCASKRKITHNSTTNLDSTKIEITNCVEKTQITNNRLTLEITDEEVIDSINKTITKRTIKRKIINNINLGNTSTKTDTIANNVSVQQITATTNEVKRSGLKQIIIFLVLMLLSLIMFSSFFKKF